MLRSGTLISSGAVKGVSGLLSSSGGEFGLFQDDQQGCQGTPSCCEGILGVPLEPMQGNQELFRAEGELVSFFLAAGSLGFHSRFKRSDMPLLVVLGEVGIPLELKQEMGPHVHMRWETWGSS